MSEFTVEMVDELVKEAEELIVELQADMPKRVFGKPLFNYQHVSKESIQNNVEYPVFIEWDKENKSTVHLHKSDEDAREAKAIFDSKNCKVYPLKSRVAKIVFTAKEVDLDE